MKEEEVRLRRSGGIEYPRRMRQATRAHVEHIREFFLVITSFRITFYYYLDLKLYFIHLSYEI